MTVSAGQLYATGSLSAAGYLTATAGLSTSTLTASAPTGSQRSEIAGAANSTLTIRSGGSASASSLTLTSGATEYTLQNTGSGAFALRENGVEVVRVRSGNMTVAGDVATQNARVTQTLFSQQVLSRVLQPRMRHGSVRMLPTRLSQSVQRQAHRPRCLS